MGRHPAVRGWGEDGVRGHPYWDTQVVSRSRGAKPRQTNGVGDDGSVALVPCPGTVTFLGSRSHCTKSGGRTGVRDSRLGRVTLGDMRGELWRVGAAGLAALVGAGLGGCSRSNTPEEHGAQDLLCAMHERGNAAAT